MKVLINNDYKDHENARKYHRSGALERRIEAAGRSGKTMSLRHEIIETAYNNPYRDYVTLVCAPEYGHVSETLEKPINQKIADLGLLAGKNESKHFALLKNGRRIVYRSLDNEESLLGLDVYAAFVDEAYLRMVKKSAIDYVRARLVLTNGRLTLAGTPKGTSSWQYHEYFEEFYAYNKAKLPPNTEYFKYDIRNNPVITEEAITRMKENLDPLLVKQEIYGEWVNLTEHAVYHAFNKLVNVKDFGLIPHEQIYIGLDYNIGINAWLAIQYDRLNKNIYVHTEGYGAKTTRDVALQIINAYGREAIIVDDASGNIRQQGDGKTQREILLQNGLGRITSNTSNPPREQRYANVNAHLLNGLGQAHLFIHPRCKKLINELQTLCYRPNSDVPDDLGGKAGHITDALGYPVYYLSGGSAAWNPKQRLITRAA